MCAPLRTCSSDLLNQLHWLPVEFRIRFKLACLAYKALSTSKSTYLHALLTPYTLPRCLRSSGTRLLAEPRYRTVIWALVHSISLLPGNGIDLHSLFVAQTLGDRTKWYWTKWYGQNGSNFYRFQFNLIEF